MSFLSERGGFMADMDIREKVPASDWGLRFLGVGSSHSTELGSAAAVLERADRPLLLIDCGHGTPAQFHERYGQWPRSLFITHVHLDHVGGLEQLYTRLALEADSPARIYVPAEIVALLHQRVASLASPLAEGSGNFWDAFQLIPVSGGFWHDGQWFDVFEARHHAPRFAFGLRLAGRFVYTGDTRPIPEVLRRYGNTGERLFHDCALHANPSHTGWADIEREYEFALRRRMVLYHYESIEAGRQLRERGAVVAYAGGFYGFHPETRGGGASDLEPGLRLAS
ncbi:MAG: MBL fold metallo-hydrolase [Lysobacterales bacterium]|jgi:ribonuclease BN (tRNA processing enzyme)